MFKQLHINISLTDALVLIPKYQKMLKSLLSNKEKLLELANTPLNENCLAVILKKLPEKLGDPGKFLIPYGFSELKCKALGYLGASINLMPLSEEFEAYLASDSFLLGNSNPSSPLLPFHNSLSGSTTSSSPSLPISETSDYSLEEFADELAHFTFPPVIDYLPFDVLFFEPTQLNSDLTSTRS
ncbi:hypothetical protein Tco_0462446 [Tanacetum coccineum]